jgi:hypothetical protein
VSTEHNEPGKDEDVPTVHPVGSSWVQEPSIVQSLGIELHGNLSASQLTPEVMRALSDLLTAVQTHSIEPDENCPALANCDDYNAGGGGCSHLQGCRKFSPILAQ